MEKYSRPQIADIIAQEVHKNQTRIGGAPYIVHPRSVAKILIDAGVKDEDVLCAAAVHDTIEDTSDKGAVRKEIYELLGPKVLSMVEKLSRKGNSHDLANRDAYKQQILSAGPDVQILKIADYIDNCADLSILPDGKRQRKVDDYVFYRELARGVSPALYEKILKIKLS
jgi:GTP diphosphokinase / guanosine-3',5'-bis(diphosphate) 3'-diphosphatase